MQKMASNESPQIPKRKFGRREFEGQRPSSRFGRQPIVPIESATISIPGLAAHRSPPPFSPKSNSPDVLPSGLLARRNIKRKRLPQRRGLNDVVLVQKLLDVRAGNLLERFLQRNALL